jgi:hypothetical protein
MAIKMLAETGKGVFKGMLFDSGTASLSWSTMLSLWV